MVKKIIFFPSIFGDFFFQKNDNIVTKHPYCNMVLGFLDFFVKKGNILKNNNIEKKFTK